MSLSDDQRALLLDESLLARVADIVTVLDTEGQVLASTAELRLTLGYALDTWAGRNLSNLVHPDDLPRVDAALTHLANHPDDVATGELRFRHALGHWEIIEYEAVNRLGTVGGLVVTSRVVTAARQRERLRSRESEILELIGNGGSLAATFYAIARLVEEHSDDGCTAVLLLDEHDVLRAGAAPSIPRELFATVDGLRLDAEAGAFGWAVHHSSEHHVNDVSTEPDLAMLRDAFARCGLRGYWSVPITYANRDHGLGSIVTFYPHHRGPGPYERDAVEAAARLAGTATEPGRLATTTHPPPQ